MIASTPSDEFPIHEDDALATASMSSSVEQPQLPIVAINLWYHVGSKNEERHQRGFTHLFEHLMFEGSAHYPGDFFKHLQPLGANINGSTSSDRTNYFVDLPTAHAERAIAMESDRMANLLGALDQSKLDIQKDVVKNEYRQNYANRPYGMVWPLIAEALYPPAAPLQLDDDRRDGRPRSGDHGGCFGFFPPVLRSQQRQPGDRRRSRRGRSAGAGGTLLRADSRRVARRCGPGSPSGPSEDTPRSCSAIASSSIGSISIWPTVPHFHADDAALLLLGDVLARGRSSRLHRKLVIEEQIAQDVTAYQSGRELAGRSGSSSRCGRRGRSTRR